MKLIKIRSAIINMPTLTEKLNYLTQHWKNMDRSTEEHRKAAEEFYKKELMPVLIEHFVKHNSRPEYNCEALILTLGTSYEPLVFSILTLKPEKVMILYTDRTQHLIYDVIEFTKLRPSQLFTSRIDAENPLELYKEIKNIYTKWGKPQNIYIDFTSGTKSMLAGSAMAGAVINAKLVYIASEFNVLLRKPNPGSERLVLIDDPYKVFGDFDKERAITLFNNMDYLSAYREFDELDQRTDTKEYCSLKYLAKAYESWDSLDFDGAVTNMSNCIELISIIEKSNNYFTLCTYKEKMKKQLEVLNTLKTIHKENNKQEHKAHIFNNIGYLIANLYQNAMRRERQGKYEMASLLLYRILEVIEQKRLWNYGIDTANADYSKLSMDSDVLLEKINRIREKIYDFDKCTHLDKQIGLLAGFILLAALQDDIIRTQKPGKEIGFLNELRRVAEIRNNSIFAHGYEFINYEKYNDLKKVVEKYINKLCELEGINIDELFELCEFIALE